MSLLYSQQTQPQQYYSQNNKSVIYSTTYNPKKYETFGVDRSKLYELQSYNVNVEELNKLLRELNEILNEHYKEIAKHNKIVKIIWLITIILFFPTLGLILFLIIPIMAILQFKLSRFTTNNYRNVVVPSLKQVIENENIEYSNLGLSLHLNFDLDHTIVTRHSRVKRGHRYVNTRSQHTITNNFVELIISKYNTNFNPNTYKDTSYNATTNNYQPSYQQQNTNASYYYQKV